MYVIGIGTGRCGTMSLARLLDECHGCCVQHELGAPHRTLPWHFDVELAQSKLSSIKNLPGDIRGDVAFYYLNYVDFFFECLPDVRVIHIYRDKASVVDSFLKKTAGRNHWMSNSEDYRKDIQWDKCFPKYKGVKSKEEAIAKYYDEYMYGVADLMTKYANDIFNVNIRDLNNEHMQHMIFDFLNIPAAKRIVRKVRANKFYHWEGLEAEKVRHAAVELIECVPTDDTLIFVDQACCPEIPGARLRVLPFLEKDGVYWGPPGDDATAICELERLRNRGATFVAFAWPAFWWLEYYAGLNRHLRSRYRCVLENDRLIIFDMRCG